MKIGDLVLYYSSIKRSAEGPRDVGLITGFADVDVEVLDDTPLASDAREIVDRDVIVQWISNDGDVSYYTQEGLTHNPYLEVVS